jgi:hypothetical protein
MCGSRTYGQPQEEARKADREKLQRQLDRNRQKN